MITIAGVDEVGRGPLAGPVVAAAVILDPARPIVGIKDSKKLSERARERLFIEINESAIAVAIGRAEVSEIDSINILQASMQAMARAVNALKVTPQQVLVDGNRCPAIDIPCRAIIGGDNIEQCIAAASIIAKVTRDREMITLDSQFPEYGFAKHKGYGTKAHLAALIEHGITPHHRHSFAPVARIAEGTAQA